MISNGCESNCKRALSLREWNSRFEFLESAVFFNKDIFQHENLCRCKVIMNGKICDFDSEFIDEHMEHYEEGCKDISQEQGKTLEEKEHRIDEDGNSCTLQAMMVKYGRQYSQEQIEA